MPAASPAHKTGRRGPSHQIEGPNAHYLRECFVYDASTGSLLWRERPLGHFRATRTRTAEHNQRIWNAKFAGKPAGSFNPRTGYLHVLIGRRSYLVHRVIWALVTGEWPHGEIDHEDGIRTNNRWRNLRPATRLLNNQNQVRRGDNSSGATGVGQTASGRWRVRLRDRTIGTFETFDAAIAARRRAEQESGLQVRRGEGSK